jgi:hypothetical protein
MPSPSTRALSSPKPRQNTGCLPRHVDWSVEPACRRKSGRASISRSRPTRAGKRSGLGARSYRALARRSARALPPGPPEHIDGDKPNALWRASKDVGSKRLAAWRSRASQSSTEARGFLRLEKVTLSAGDIVTRPSRELRAARASPRRRCRQSCWPPPKTRQGHRARGADPLGESANRCRLAGLSGGVDHEPELLQNEEEAVRQAGPWRKHGVLS